MLLAALLAGSIASARADTAAMSVVEGALLVHATVRGARRETEGAFLLDLGAGFVSLDRPVARALELSAEMKSADPVTLLSTPLSSITIGSRRFEQLSPVLLVDLTPVRQALDRRVLGLLGESLFEHGLTLFDDRHGRLVMVRPLGAVDAADSAAGLRSRIGSAKADEHPAEKDSVGVRERITGDAAASRREYAAWLPAAGVAVPFARIGDGKLVLRVSIGGIDSLCFVLDTGATKTALFRRALSEAGVDASGWPALGGLESPTLYGTPNMSLVRVPSVRLGSVVADSIDASLLDGDVALALDRSVGERVHGLLGRSFLRRFDVAIDGDRGLLWLSPRAGSRDERAWEYSTVGIQIERRGRALVVAGVAAPSPAAEAGIRAGDRLLAIDARDARTLDAIAGARALEGPPGSAVRVTIEGRSGRREVRLVRRILL